MVSCGSDDDTPSPVSPNGPPGIGGRTVKVLNDVFESTQMVVVGDPDAGYITAFHSVLQDGVQLSFTEKFQSIPAVMEDNEGNLWNVFGEAVEGPRTGQRLTPAKGYMGYWYAFTSMFQDVELYDGAPDNSTLPIEQTEPSWTIGGDYLFVILGQDAIPAIDEPKFEAYNERIAIDEGYFVGDDELVAGIEVNGTVHLYPQRIMNWHEIANDVIADEPIVFTFCPLTATPIAWKRTLSNGTVSTFGVSGLLHNSNVIPYDRDSESRWSQMLLSSINGPRRTEQAEQVQVVEATWEFWKQLYEAPLVLTRETGSPKDYSVNPYQEFVDQPEFIAYPTATNDERLPKKERVYGIIGEDGAVKVYQFKDFE